MYREIMAESAYMFRCEGKSPLIIDCGSNIGLSVIYFKHLYPDARILAFEPDPQIFEVLRRNIAAYGFEGVELRNSAVWIGTGLLGFRADGAVGGRLCPTGRGPADTQVQAERLYNYLDRKVDLLKLDIEGAELEVLQDCRDRLLNVERLFVEYHGKPDVPQQLESLLGILRLAGFRYHMKDANPVAHPFLAEERGKLYDLQLNIYAYRD
jgi:FkbM family methyltransferase